MDKVCVWVCGCDVALSVHTQAMVHELIGIHNHRVDLRALTGKASKDQGEIVLSPLQDTFFEQHMFDNYGDLGQAVKGMVDTFQVRDHASSPLLSALR